MAKMTPLGTRFKENASPERSFVLETTRKFQSPMAALTLGLAFALLPGLGGAFDLFAQNAPVPMEQASTADTLSQNQALLLRARHSLMGRDIASAERFVEEAAALSPAYSEASDRPEYVGALITEFKAVQIAAQTEGMSESVRRGLARSYLNQADALRRCRDYNGAESLVQEATKLNVAPETDALAKGMDAAAIMRRISDDRLASERLAAPAGNAEAPTGLSDATLRKVAEVRRQISTARVLLSQGKTDEAEAMARQLQAVGLPESVFADGDSPNALLGDVAIVRSSARGSVVPSAFVEGQTPNEGAIRQVQGVEVTEPNKGESNGYLYVQEADTALRAGNNQAALVNYRDALRYASELDAETVKRVNDAIAKLNNPITAAPEPAPTASGLDFAKTPQDLQGDISAFIAKAYQTRKTNPNEALAALKGLREEIEKSSLEAGVKNHFHYTVDMAISDTNRFIEVNGPMIALKNQNENVEDQLRAKREKDVQIQNRLAEDTEKFNQLLEDGKFEEAEILAKKCRDYSDNSVVSIQMVEMARTSRQVAFNKQLKERKEAGFLSGMNDVESAAIINVSDANPLAYGPRWDVAKNRKAVDLGNSRPEADRKILEKLEMRVTLPFDQPMPIETVMDYISENLKINILMDWPALEEAGITSDTPVETKLTDISLKNYFKHVLSPYNLTYVVADEALTVTDKSKLRGNVTEQVYDVTDLVTPIPNFNEVNSPLSMQASFDRAFKSVRPASGARSVTNTIPVANNAYSGSMLSPNILAQIQAAGSSAPITTGASGGTNDPEELISLITSVVDPESWEDVGEPQFFTLNNSLIIRQNEENHQEIRDLLEKLRSLMDLQIAVEVRYVSISDEYYERIGVNFGASLHANGPTTSGDNGLEPNGKGIYGITSADPAVGKPFTETLTVDFSQNSYGLAVPQFGAYDPSAGAQLGFAILSDIETYFFISAAEGDQRTNIMQAPKVMMMNGQMAMVQDVTQIPYVYTVIPVVGDFAVAQQPVVTVINEGQFMTVQAAVSPDRQYVRMTVSPFFSQVTDSTREFKFEGTDTTTTSNTSSSKGSDKEASVNDERENVAASERISTGTTIQQPVISNFSVMTTVTVPDGGTVMLGGIKRLSEGRNEAGVPLLSKIPYIKRLFSNTSVGRTTSSMMMMVTPRIIIKDEEEQYLTGLTEEDFKSGAGQPIK